MLEVFRLNGALLRHGAALTAPLRQTQARWQVIGAVAEAARTVPQIARRMGMTRQGVQRVADLLVDEGLVACVRNPDHARSPLLRLTAHGRRVEQQLGDVAEAELVAQAPQHGEQDAVGRVVEIVEGRPGSLD